MKKLLSLLLTLSLAVFVVGCENKDKANTPKKSSGGKVNLNEKGSMPDGSDNKGAESGVKATKPQTNTDEGSDKKAETPKK